MPLPHAPQEPPEPREPESRPDGALGRTLRDVRDAGRTVVARRWNDAEEHVSTYTGSGSAPTRSGTEDPKELARALPMVERAFAFVDLTGFTGYMAEHGEHAAIETLQSCRTLIRDLATRRGVRVAKWLGDGAMLVGVEPGPTIAVAAELIGRYDGHTLAVRGGVAHGQVLLFEGDDYIGRPVNLAARLCAAANPGELLATGYDAPLLPSWMEVLSVRTVKLKGIGRRQPVQSLGIAQDVELPTLTVPVVPPE